MCLSPLEPENDVKTATSFFVMPIGGDMNIAEIVSIEPAALEARKKNSSRLRWLLLPTIKVVGILESLTEK